MVDPDVAPTSAFGRWVAGAGEGPLGWAVRTDAIEAVAARHGLDVVDGSRARPDGSVLRWRLAGVERAVADPALPFFIEWGDSAALPGAAAVRHPAGDVSLAGVTVRPGRFVSVHLEADAGGIVL